MTQCVQGKLVDERYQPDLAAIVGLGFHKVIGPDMVALPRCAQRQIGKLGLRRVP
jgi:hypothetical protein